jgi:phospholipid N-methyltransferase
MNYTATYSPDDNKLRLYAGGRLSPELYARVKAAGFGWAPKQDLFVAPSWTPWREDLLLELCDEIGDEDKSLSERAEDRAERFEDYSEARASDAESARKAVSAIADNIPLGQPILIGHHSERHARRDAEKIENGMRRAVKMWETSKYWEQRAAGAIQHAKYKERPDVRARRIKGIEADKRKQEKYKAEAVASLKLWSAEGLTLEQARLIANYSRLYVVRDVASNSTWSAWDVLRPDEERYKACPAMTVSEVQEIAKKSYPATIAHCERWIAHYDNRLAYERAMLADAGGTVADRTGPEKGGACKCWASPRGGWSLIQKVNKVSVTVLDNWGNGGENFTRTIPFDKLAAMMSKAEVDAARAEGRIVGEDARGFGLCDAAPVRAKAPEVEAKDTGADFEAMRETLKAGVKIVSAPQLFPTPPDLAARMVALAEIEDGHRILEPEAGTGNIVVELQKIAATLRDVRIEAVEINLSIASALASRCKGIPVIPGDFLEKTLFELGGRFDRVVMNPPFQNGDDIKHIQHAASMLKPGGRLVALCANGPRQREKLIPMAAQWEDLPAGTFKEQGTGVSTALLVIERED